MTTMKRRLAWIAALAMLLPAINGWAYQTDGPIRRPTLISCPPAEWDQEARRYDLEGTNIVQYSVDEEGRPVGVGVVRSSGWKILDYMAIRATKGCRFEASTDPNVVRAGLRSPFNWKLDAIDETPVPAALVPGSCQATTHLADFRPFTGKVIPRHDAILVRFLLDDQGRTFGIKFEESDPSFVSAGTAFIQSCRFSPAMLNGRPVHGNLYGWIMFK